MRKSRYWAVQRQRDSLKALILSTWFKYYQHLSCALDFEKSQKAFSVSKLKQDNTRYSLAPTMTKNNESILTRLSKTGY